MNKYLNLVKFSHTIFAMPFAMIGYVLAVKAAGFSIYSLLGVVLCMIFARNAAMGFNRYADRNIDAKNERTASREIPAGVISPRRALAFIVINCVLFLFTTLFLNMTAFFLSPVALAVILGYSLTKRFTWLCHMVLGLGLAIAPSAAYIAVTGELTVVVMFFSMLVLCWVSGFDIIYALQDEQFDKNEKLHSIPSVFGRKGALIISAALHIIVIFLAFYIYFAFITSVVYLCGAIIFSLLVIYQHLIVKPNDISRVNLAFGTTNGIGSVVFALFTVVAILIA